jgi:hypothetical protein
MESGFNCEGYSMANNGEGMSNVNPYQSPTADSVAVEHTPEKAKVARNIRLICLLYVLFGLVGFGVGVALLLSEIEASNFGQIMVVTIAGLCGFISGMGVLLRKKWGLVFCQIVSIFFLASIPIGTLLGGYVLLNINKLRDEFR